MDYPKNLRNLIEMFKKMPGVGEKTAERYAFSILSMPIETVEQFKESLYNAKTKTKKCHICNNITEEDICSICSNDSRNKEVICVVDDPKNTITIEKIGNFNGMYHVLDGLISPLDGINPEDINIDSLIKRIEDGNFKEIILALRTSIEGETTTLYIKKILQNKNVKLSKIAHGVPLGIDMSYVDELTISTAFENRNIIS